MTCTPEMIQHYEFVHGAISVGVTIVLFYVAVEGVRYIFDGLHSCCDWAAMKYKEKRNAD